MCFIAVSSQGWWALFVICLQIYTLLPGLCLQIYSLDIFWAFFVLDTPLKLSALTTPRDNTSCWINIKLPDAVERDTPVIGRWSFCCLLQQNFCRFFISARHYIFLYLTFATLLTRFVYLSMQALLIALPLSVYGVNHSLDGWRWRKMFRPFFPIPQIFSSKPLHLPQL